MTTSAELRPHRANLTGATRIGATALGVLAIATTLGRRGRRALGAPRRQLVRAAGRSRQYSGTAFANRLPPSETPPVAMTAIAAAMLTRDGRGKPANPIPVAVPAFANHAAGGAAVNTADSPAELAATWLGHASVLLEIDGRRVLADPVWSERVSPVRGAGPRRLHAVPLPLDALPPLDAIVISHDHYDHLDVDTVTGLLHTQAAPFFVPLGVGAHLRSWGVPDTRIVELDWDEDARVGELTITCTEARHFSGRGLARNTTLWSSWTLVGPRHRVFFGGDTGYTPAFAGIGARFGPFDLTVLPIGAYNHRWPDIHLDPEHALRAHHDLGGRWLLPIHWATFDLAFHRWSEPIERLLAAAESTADGGDTRLALPPPGGRFDASAPAPPDPWWLQAGGRHG